MKRTRRVMCGSSMTDRKSTRLNSSHSSISYAVFCLKKKKINALVSMTHYINTLQAEIRTALAMLSFFLFILLHLLLVIDFFLFFLLFFFFFFNDPATTEIYTLSLHDALPIFHRQFRIERRTTAGQQAQLRPELSVKDRKSTRLNSSHSSISYAVFCLKKKTKFSCYHFVVYFNPRQRPD